jgi:hypothetical protein
MTHDELQDLLEAYVDETLDRSSRAEVDRHLAECDGCRAILDGVPAVHLGEIGPTSFDDKAMRRAIRASLFRLAFNVIGVLAVGWLTLTLLGYLVFQPFIVNRGDRAAAATQVTQDIAVLLNPGASLDNAEHNSGIVRRTSEATVVVPLGTRPVQLGTVETVIDPLSFRSRGGGSIFPFLAEDYLGEASEVLTAVGDGTVALVEIYFDTPISVERAQQLADSPIDVRVVWAGFAVGEGEPTGPGIEPGGVVGYGTCDPRDTNPDALGAASAGYGVSPFSLEPSIARALDATRAAIDNLADHDDLLDGSGPWVTPASVGAARNYLADHAEVRTLVVTGPTPELLRFLDEAGPASASVRGIDFTNWYQPLCGK